MIPVELTSGVVASLRWMGDHGEQPPRCQDVAIRVGIAEAVRRLAEVDTHALVAELQPGGERILLCGVDDGWRLVRFVDGDDVSLRPETSRRVTLQGSGPDAVLAALGVTRPDGVELQYSDEYLGQGQTEYRHGYQWTDGGRTIVAEEIKTEIFDGATPYSTYLRGVIIDGDGGVLLTGRDDSALITEG